MRRKTWYQTEHFLGPKWVGFPSADSDAPSSHFAESLSFQISARIVRVDFAPGYQYKAGDEEKWLAATDEV